MDNDVVLSWVDKIKLVDASRKAIIAKLNAVGLNIPTDDLRKIERKDPLRLHEIWQFMKKSLLEIVFDMTNGGQCSVDKKQITNGDPVGDLPTPVYETYTFKGWYNKTSGGDKIESTTIPEDDLTCYAHWLKNYIIEFSLINGGTCSEELERDISPGSMLGNLPTPTYEGLEFDGWFTNLVGGNQILSSTVPTGDSTYYALYHFILTLNGNGGLLDLEHGQEKYSLHTGDKWPTLYSPSRNNYQFLGWSLNSAEGSTLINTSGKCNYVRDTTIYAQWKKTLGECRIKVVDATILSLPTIVPNLILVDGLINSTAYLTDGYIHIEVPDSTFLLKVLKDGYFDYIFDHSYNDLNYKSIPMTPKVNGYSIVLQWGAEPRDLDSHCYIKNSYNTVLGHVYYSSKKYSGHNTTVVLDVDDTTSYGPETTTIDPYNLDLTYKFYVHLFSGTGTIGQGNQVYVTINSEHLELPKIIHCNNATNTGKYWHVFDINNRVLTEINKFESP